MRPRDGGGLGYLLLRAAQCWRADVAAALRPHDLTPSQFIVLVTVLRRQASPGSAPVMQRDLGETTGMDANTASQIVRSLVARGLLRRTAHPHDGRAVALALTSEGSAATRRCGTLVRAVNERFFPAGEGPELARMLEALIERSDRGRS